MFIGYKNNKIIIYSEEPVDINTYGLDLLEETQDEYVLSDDCTEYVLKDAAWYEEQARKERERIAKLCLTRGDVFRGLLQAKGVTRAQLRANIEAMPDSMQKEMALIDFDEALNFYRGNSLVDVVGNTLGITSEQLDRFFETNDYHELINSEEIESTQEGEENIGEDNSTQGVATLENTPDFLLENEDLDNNEGEQENDD